MGPIRLTGRAEPPPPTIDDREGAFRRAGRSHGAGRRLGEAEAEVAHLRLAVEESLARERRLIERALGTEQALEDALTVEHDLREQIGRYAHFHAPETEATLVCALAAAGVPVDPAGYGLSSERVS